MLSDRIIIFVSAIFFISAPGFEWSPIVYEKTAIEKWNKKNISIEEGIKLEELDKSSTWYKVRRELKKQLGEFVDKVWFSKLRVEENIDKKILTLYAPSNFTRDWINNKYGYVVRQLSKELGYQEVITTLNNQ
ncbi:MULTISPECIES: DnaA N-terminal domain-containing protein [unclassified Candidatus Tisiphia]|uniref:DnaA N-terminal domain-containing protein n=1 Tax=unclassified Candidatus Tisiphia TaxID=2996318 RepID=UPI00312CB3D7